jgi:hypothetical protein
MSPIGGCPTDDRAILASLFRGDPPASNYGSHATLAPRNDDLDMLLGAQLGGLTFATVLPRVGYANVEIQSHTRKITSADVPLVLTFVNQPAATPYECQNRDISGCMRRPAFPAPSKGEQFTQDSGASRRENAQACLEHPRAGKQIGNHLRPR